MGKKNKKGQPGDDWLSDEAELDPDLLIVDKPQPDHVEEGEAKKDKKLSKKEQKAAAKRAAFEAEREQLAGPLSDDEGAAADSVRRSEASDDEDEGRKGKKGKGKEKKAGKKGKMDFDEDEADEDLDFGRKKKGGKKGGKKNRGDDSEGEEPSKPEPVDDDDDFDFGGKKKGSKKAGKKDKGIKPANEDGDNEAEEAPATEAPSEAPKIVARIISVSHHPDKKATKLSVCQVDAGAKLGTLQVVCGGTNVRSGLLCVLAPIGSSVSTKAGPIAIKPAKVRNCESNGMLCGRGELGLLKPGEAPPTVCLELPEAGFELGTPFDPSMMDAAPKGAVPTLEPDARMAATMDGEMPSGVNALTTWMVAECAIGAADAVFYAEALAEDGFDSALAIAEIEDGDWPSVIKKGHRKTILRMAQKALGEGPAARAAAQAPAKAAPPAPPPAAALPQEEEEERLPVLPKKSSMAEALMGDDDSESGEEEPPSRPATTSGFAAALMGSNEEEDDDEEEEERGGEGVDELDSWLRSIEVPSSVAAAYAKAISIKVQGGLSALLDAGLTAKALEAAGLKPGHASLVKAEAAFAKDVAALPNALTPLASWLVSAGLPRLAALSSAETLSSAGLGTIDALRAVDSSALGKKLLDAPIGMRRGHAALVAVALGAVLPPCDEAQHVVLPAFDFGASRKRRHGPSSLLAIFPPDDDLPLFFFKRDEPELAAAAAELAAAADVADAELSSKSKKKKKAKTSFEDDEEEPPSEPKASKVAVEEDDAEFDFSAKPKKKKKPKVDFDEIDEPASPGDISTKPKKKKKVKAVFGAESDSDVGFDFGVDTKKDKNKKAEAISDSDDDIGFSFKSTAKEEAKPSKPEKEDKKKRKSKEKAKAAEEDAPGGADDAEIAAMLAELEAGRDEAALKLAIESRRNALDAEAGGSSAEGNRVPDDGSEDGDEDGGGGISAMAGAKKGKKDKKKKKKGKAEADIEDEDDEMALLERLAAENAALRGEDTPDTKDKKKKKKKKGGGDEAGDGAEGVGEEAEGVAASDAPAVQDDAHGDGAGDEEGDEVGADGKQLSKAQKKKLKAKQKKTEEDKSKDKPKSAIAEKLRAAQEARAREEKAMNLYLELADEAQRLDKALSIVRLGDKALRKLDSADVSKEVDDLLARCEEAAAEFEDNERIVKIHGAVIELRSAMTQQIEIEERRRKAREKEKERKERMRAEGKLLTKAEKEKAIKQQAFLATLGKTGAVAGEQEDGDGAPRKRVVYANRKKLAKKTGDEVATMGSAAESEEAAPTDKVEDEAAAVPPATDVGAPGEGSNDADRDNDAEVSEEDWDAVDLDAKIAASGIKADSDSEEEEFTFAPSLSSKLAALADETKKAKEDAERAAQAKLDKLYNFKAKEGEEGSDNDDDSDSDDDSEEEDELEAGKAAARAEREARTKVAMEARTPERLRSPICCIMGHVDTGKTKLLDNIRRTHVQDGEAGGITQQIGASFFPNETLVERMGSLYIKQKVNVRVPGLLIIDTPGHESFSNLRSRGSSLCDIAILVIDIMHGLEPQTIESMNMLRSKQTPFVIALNKVDRLYGWNHVKDRPFIEAIEEQDDSVKREFEHRASAILLSIAEQGLNAQLYYRNKDPREYISLCPTSAHTGEGVADILMNLVGMTQKMFVDRIMWTPMVQCTVLEVKVIEGLGATADVILANGTLKRGDRIVMCGFGGPVVTRVRDLLTPRPLRELRVKTDYIHHQQIDGAAGIKICANHLDNVVAGSACLVPFTDVPYDLEVLKEDAMQDLNKLAKAASEVNGGLGVYAVASTLGSLEALLEFLKTSKIPVSAVNIGPIHKKDIIKASIMHEFKPEYATILAFDVNVTKEAEIQAKESQVKIFTAEIIYHLFDKFTAYMADVRREQQEKAATTAVFPVICEISSPDHVWCRGGGGDPILVGLHVKEGTLKRGTPLCVERRGQKDPETGLQAYLDIGRVMSMEVDHKPADAVKAGKSAAVKIDAVTSIAYGRQFDHTYPLYARVTRRSIDAIKEFFKEDLGKDDWALLLKLKKQYGVI